jgi:hypothetical protein
MAVNQAAEFANANILAASVVDEFAPRIAPHQVNAS